MKCPYCDFENQQGKTRCQQCHKAIDQATVTEFLGAQTGWSVPASQTQDTAPVELNAGSMLGERYEILRLLGEGGMGAVYQARDRELDRMVAVKVIRPEMARRPEILRRFKQELILARQITHRNVIRIYDLGQAEGIKFITMEYIEGEDIRSILRRDGKYTPEKAVDILIQVCHALDAAHAEGVVHRDLKPQNIMIDQEERLLVMDFGVARSTEMAGFTHTGTLIGTPEYMSPEQAKGEHVDQRSDLFALGIIFYEILTGKIPYQANTLVGMLLKRMQEKPVPPVEVDQSIPQPLSDIVMKCLQVDLTQRYQNAKEILQDLELWRNPEGAVVAAKPILGMAPRTWAWLASGLALATVLSVGLMVWQRFTKPPPAQKPITLLVADFQNTTGDKVFDGTLEPMFSLAMEGAAFVDVFDRGKALLSAGQVLKGATRLDESVAKLVAGREGIHVVLHGSIAREGGGFTVSAKAVDTASGKEIAARQTSASNKEEVLRAVSKLAAPIRRALGDRTPESVQAAAAETFTAASPEAAHAYATAQALVSVGKWDEALRSYLHALQLDPELGRAYAGMATVYRNMRNQPEAEKYFQLAMKRIHRMTDREKYRTRGVYYGTIGNQTKAIEEFSALVKAFPADNTGYGNLAVTYFLQRDFAKAMEVGRKAVEIYPRSLMQRNNLAWFALYAGSFAVAEKEARAVLQRENAYVDAHMVVAMSLMGQGKPAEAMAAFHNVEKVSIRGASMAGLGLADIAMYEGRAADAVAILERSIAGDLAANNPAYAAIKMGALGQAHLLRGNKAAAVAAADRALATAKTNEVSVAAARIYLEAGQAAKARAVAAELGKRLAPDWQAYSKLIAGEALSKRGSVREAIGVFQEAQKISDTWLGRFLLGRAYLEMEAYTEANSEFELCLKRRGEAATIYLDDLPTFRELPPVYYYIGRSQDGLQSDGGAESYRTFLGIKKGTDDPLLADVRKRIAGR